MSLPARTLAAVLLPMLVHLPVMTRAQVNEDINKEVWKQKYGVLDAQMNEQAPYGGWLSLDSDGDGVTNRNEFLAGTNPFKKLPGEANFRPPGMVKDSTTLSLTIPTVPGKSYGVESSTLMDAWSRGSLPTVTGDGNPKTLVVPTSAGKFFRISVSDQATQGDQVSDWAKIALGFSTEAPLGTQSGYSHTTLAAKLHEQNVVKMSAIDTAGTQPPDGGIAASDFALLRITRSGYLSPGAVTVPLIISGTAVAGTDYLALPSTVTFPAGVNSQDIKITPRFNVNRTSSRTVMVTAGAPGTAGASGNYTLGTPAFAGATLCPPGNATGTGLTANFYPGSSGTYSSPLNFSDLTGASYSYTRTPSTNNTQGTVTVTYASSPTTPYAVGGTVQLQTTSGNLGIDPFNTMRSYTITALPTAASFTVAISGTGLPGSGSGNVNLGGFRGLVTMNSPVVDYTWGHGTPNGNNYIEADNYSVVWEGYLSPSAAADYFFRLDADDKARLSINLGSGYQTVVENGWDSAATGTYKISAAVPLIMPAGPEARYPIRLEFVETTGNARCRLQWKQGAAGTYATIPAANVWKDTVATMANGTNNVWNATYYNNPTFTPPAARTQGDGDPTAGNNGDWLAGSPDPLVFHNNFSSRWTGQVMPQYSQTYYFVTRVNEGSKLWVNNQLILDRWTGASGSDQTASIDLEGGVLYDIKLEHYETTGSSEAHLWWYSEDQAKQIIPTNRLFPSISGTVAAGGDAPAGEPTITSPVNPVVVTGLNPSISFPVTSSNGGTITTSGLPDWLELSNGILSGIPPAPGIYQFTVTTTNAAGSGSAVVTLEVIGTGKALTRELWTTTTTGPGLADVPWTTAPNTTNSVTTAEDNTTTYGTNTGERLRGYFVAPVTGNYYFWIAASNEAELWISNNGEAVNKVLRAKVSGPAGTGVRTWDVQAGQKSQWLSLVAGRKYYLEALHNTGNSGAGNSLSVAWFLDPTGVTVNPLANGSAPAPPAAGGVIPAAVLSPWDNPPTTTVPGTLHVTNLQGAEGLENITATGGAFLRVNGTNAVLQLNYGGLSSGAISRKIYNGKDEVIFDIDAQDRNYPGLRTSDGGYSWTLKTADITDLNQGKLRLEIATVNHPTGEIAGTFGKTAGSQTPPAVPAYPSWPDEHAANGATGDAANSRFLTQATFGPSPADMAAVRANGYRAWIEGQFTTASTRNIPYILANLSNDPQNTYGSSLFFNSWWKNSVTAPDQLRQRAAFALSEIVVVSDTGALNNNGRTLADYYDTLLDHSFGNFRDILKQVTLSSAMGVYLDMRGNAAGNIQTGVHPNENYAREILQLFSAGLYRVWPDGTLVLDSTGGAVPTYDQSVVTGLARVFTGWHWGQAMTGDRLPINFNPSSNYLDPMVLVPTRHELGTKVLLDNVVQPAATVTSQSDTTTDPASGIDVQTTDPLLGPGNLVTKTITNRYDLNGLKDLEVTLDNIMANAATGPYICRQLIQRLVTSHPKPEYVHRVTRAFNGEQNVDGIATAVRGDMKEVFRAILLDYEARSTSAAADPKYGKQREPLLRFTGPARAFPSSPVSGATYRQLGLQQMLITTPVPHRLVNGENILLGNFTDGGGVAGKVPTTASYATKNITPGYNVAGVPAAPPQPAIPTQTATITAPGYLSGDTVSIQFTSGTLGSTAPFNTLQNYTVTDATATNFTIDLGVAFSTAFSGNCITPYNLVVDIGGLSTPAYESAGNVVTITSAGYFNGEKVFLKFSTGGLLGASFDGLYTVSGATGTDFKVTLSSSPAATSGTVLIPRLTGGYNVTASGSVSSIALQMSANHNLKTGDKVQIDFREFNSPTPAQDGIYTVDSVGGPNLFRVLTTTAITNGSQGSSSAVVYPQAMDTGTRNGTATLGYSTWNIGYTQNDLNQTPLNSATVFNFFYPDYQYPGEMAQAGMTTPEFQITNDSATMTLTNAITGSVLSAGNTYGFTSFKSGGGALTADLGPYMTPAQTSDAGIPALVDTLGVLLTGGNLSAAAETTISNYVKANLAYTTPTPTAAQMRDRVRGIVHLIITSAEYAIQR